MTIVIMMMMMKMKIMKVKRVKMASRNVLERLVCYKKGRMMSPSKRRRVCSISDRVKISAFSILPPICPSFFPWAYMSRSRGLVNMCVYMYLTYVCTQGGSGKWKGKIVSSIGARKTMMIALRFGNDGPSLSMKMKCSKVFIFFLLLLLFLLGLCHSSLLWHASEPVEEEGTEDVEDDVDEEEAKVAPAVICRGESRLVTDNHTRQRGGGGVKRCAGKTYHRIYRSEQDSYLCPRRGNTSNPQCYSQCRA